MFSNGMNCGSYSLADIAAATGGNRSGSGWGDEGGAWWIIILFLFCFMGWGRNGFGGNNEGGTNTPAAQGALTRGELCQDMNFSDLSSGVRNLADGICSLGYDQLAQINGVNSTVASGFAGVNSAICNLGYNEAQLVNGINTNLLMGQNALSTQLANCCCEEREAIQGVNYNLATQSCDTRNTIQTGIRDIIESQNAGTRAILDKMCQQELAAKDAQIAAQNQQIFGLQLAASQQAQNAYLVSELAPKLPVPAYTVPNPFASYGYNGCGCANSCFAA